jgi:energy-coupling factor transport system ATP-binding protein
MAGWLSLRDIHYTPLGAESPVLDGVSLDIARGECVAIAGVSGCGKSTLCQVLAGIIPHRLPGAFSGQVQCATAHPRIGMVFQNPDDQLFADTVAEEVAFGPRNLGYAESDIHRRLAESLDACDLITLRDHPIPALSMGQKQRVALASMLAMEPELMILDEPASNVDAASADHIYRAVTALRHQRGMAVVLVDHDLERVRRVADRVLVMEAGRLHPLSATAEANRDWPDGTVSRAPGEVLAAAEQVAFTYPGQERPLFADINLPLRTGEAVALLGPNGAGKSTLAKHFIGLLRPQVGRVVVEGADIARVKTEDLAARVGYAFQNPDDALFARTVLEEVTFAPRNLRQTREQAAAQAMNWLEALGCAHLRDREPLTLSYGEKRRVSLAAVLAADPRIVILDEPTAALDQGNARVVAAVVQRCVADGKTVLVLTHDLPFARATCTRLFSLRDGALAPWSEVALCS